MRRGDRFKWWHGVVFYAGIQLAQWSIRRTISATRSTEPKREDRAFYRRQRLPVFAPPGIAFPVAWTINSATSIAGAIHVLNLRRGRDGRNEFLRRQAAAWVLFVLFETAYFELQSPINAVLVTVAYTGVTLASIRAAIRMHDNWALLSLVPTAGWLSLANPVALAQAAWNRDPFWRIGPVCTPSKRWLK